jgi:hypothetical protein
LESDISCAFINFLLAYTLPGYIIGAGWLAAENPTAFAKIN